MAVNSDNIAREIDLSGKYYCNEIARKSFFYFRLQYAHLAVNSGGNVLLH